MLRNRLNIRKAIRAGQRNQRGILGTYLLISGMLMVFLLCSLGTDFSHLVAVRAQLRNAADAAALAGAADLFKAPENAEKNALKVCEMNMCDGINLSNDEAPVDVTATVVPPSGNDMGTVTVNVKMNSKHLVSPIYGRLFDAVGVTAVAGGAGQIVGMPSATLFPLAPSIDYVPQPKGKASNSNIDQTPLWKRKVGDIVYFYINDNNVKNAAWTTFTYNKDTKNINVSAKDIQNLVDQAAGRKPMNPADFPPVKVGDQINLGNGVLGTKEFADAGYLSDLGQKIVWLPIIEGEPAMNKTRACIGFMAVKILNIYKDNPDSVLTIQCRVEKTMVDGIPGQITATDPNWQNALVSFAPYTVKLLR